MGWLFAMQMEDTMASLTFLYVGSMDMSANQIGAMCIRSSEIPCIFRVYCTFIMKDDNSQDIIWCNCNLFVIVYSMSAISPHPQEAAPPPPQGEAWYLLFVRAHNIPLYFTLSFMSGRSFPRLQYVIMWMYCGI